MAHPEVRVHVDAALCEGHGRCYEIAPTVFDDDERGHCVLRQVGTIPSDQEPAAQRAAANCPERAITTQID